MTWQEILQNSIIAELHKNSNFHKEKHQNATFNTFTYTSGYGHYENFHSDIIAALLNPYGPHREDDKFLKLFIKYINEVHGCQINPAHYSDAKVERETGRIDIAIFGNGHAIIIENKINNAIDQDDQLQRYHTDIENRGYIVDVIIYLTLRSDRTAPSYPKIPQELIKRVVAVGASDQDLANRWVLKCKEEATTEDAKSFLHQYNNLLTAINTIDMNDAEIETFYNFLNETDSMNVIPTIQRLYEMVPKYRMDKLLNRIKSYQPFTKQYRWRPNHHLYDYYIDNGISYKLDFWFNEDNSGSAGLAFWIPQLNHVNPKEQQKKLTEKLSKLGYSDLSFSEDGKAHKDFKIEELQTMKKVDDEIHSFISDFLKKLLEDANI